MHILRVRAARKKITPKNSTMLFLISVIYLEINVLKSTGTPSYSTGGNSERMLNDPSPRPDRSNPEAIEIPRSTVPDEAFFLQSRVSRARREPLAIQVEDTPRDFYCTRSFVAIDALFGMFCAGACLDHSERVA